MTAEEEGTIQVNVRLYKTQVEEVDKLLKESKFKNRSEYIRFLIDESIKIDGTREEALQYLKDSERVLNNVRYLKEALIYLFDESGLDPELKEKTIKALTREEEVE